MLRHNLTFACRRLRSSPGFTAAAILTLALGIGANTTIFSLVNAVVFRPFGVKDQSSLVSLNIRTSKAQFPTISYPDFKDYCERNKVLSGLAMYRFMDLNVSQTGGKNARLWSYEVSGNYFDLLGVQPALGRLLHPDDDVNRGGHPVAVITYKCWQGKFGSDPGIIGKKLLVAGLSYTIVGVTPPAFIGTERIYTPEIYVPLAMSEQIEKSHWMDSRGTWDALVIARLKPGVSMKSAESALNNIAAQLAREHPKEDEGVSIVLSPPGMAGNYLRGAITGFSAVLMAVAGMVLLIACVNLASLLLARAADRRKETAIRLALGASQGQILKQLLTESLLLSFGGGASGILLAYWLNQLVNIWRPPVDVPVIPQVVMDVRVLVFAAIMSLLTTVLFGLVPALQSMRFGLAGAMKNDAPSERLRRLNLRDILVTLQVSLSVVLLIGSILVVRSLQHALSLNLGFNPEHAAVLSFNPESQGYTEDRDRELQRRLLERLRSSPGINAAGIVDGLPLTLNISNDGILMENRPVPKAGDIPLANKYLITQGYLEAMQTRLLAGRDFEEQDKKDSPLVALVNEAFVHQLLPGEGAIGRRFRHDPSGKWIQIVGVIEDGKYRSLGETPSPTIFESFDQNWSPGRTLVARSSMPDNQTTALLRHTLTDLDPTLTFFEDGSLEDRLGLALFPARLAAVILSSFGLLAVVLAATGVYGMMAYAVSKRTREIGIRMALGSAPNQVASLILKRALVLLGIGGLVGFLLAMLGGEFFSQVLYGVSPRDPMTYAVAFLLMACVAAVACWIPTRRAIRIDPLKALRTE